jgi:hypothetical protein
MLLIISTFYFEILQLSIILGETMKIFILAIMLISISGCTLHQKSTLSKVQITEKVDNLMDGVLAFALKSESHALEHGRKLTVSETKYAKSIGVKYPEKVRVMISSDFPVPMNKEVLKGFKELGFDSMFVTGITYRYGIYIKSSWLISKEYVLAHELIHVRQIEKTDNWKKYLRQYLIQAFSYEYFKMPYEHEAYKETENFKGF